MDPSLTLRIKNHMKKFLLLLLLIPFFVNCSKINELTSRDSKQKNNKEAEVTSDIKLGENTYGVIAGALKWQDKNFPPFSNINRKDKEILQSINVAKCPRKKYYTINR